MNYSLPTSLSILNKLSALGLDLAMFDDKPDLFQFEGCLAPFRIR